MFMRLKNFVIALAFALLLAPCTAQTKSAAQGASQFDWKAFHKKNDVYWAGVTGLSPQQVRKLRLASGIQDDEPSNPIDQIDATTLSHHHILFVAAWGSGHCLDIYVFAPHKDSYQNLWSDGKAPDDSGFCHPSLCAPAHAWASKKGEITVTVPRQLPDTPMGVCDQLLTLSYRWNGKARTYELAERKTIAAQCGYEDYMKSVRGALEKLAGPGETMASVDIMAAFVPESEIFLERNYHQIKMIRVVLGEQVWSKVSYLSHKITPSECIAAGEAAAEGAKRQELDIPSDEAEKFLSDLAKIDLRSDSCPRRRDGSCALIVDGTIYSVVRQDGTTARVRDIPAGSDIVSENPALLAWVNRVLDRVRLAIH